MSLDALNALVRELFDDPTGHVDVAPHTGRARVCWPNGSFTGSQPSARDLAAHYRARLAKGEGEMGAEARAALLARLDAWLAAEPGAQSEGAREGVR